MEKKSEEIKASVIIVDFLKAEKVKKCLLGFQEQEGEFSREILVLDNSQNAKNAEILKKIPHLDFLKISEKNLGYARANNICAQKAKGEFLFFLNPDIEFFKKNSIKALLNFMEQNPEVVIVGPRQRNPDGSFERTARDFPDFCALVARRTFLRRFFPDRVNRYEIAHFDFAKTQEVPWIQSSFWGVRRDFFESVGGFSETFFCFFADTEMCRQAHKKGKNVIFFAETEVRADGIRASRGGFLSFFTKKIVRIHFWDAVRYFWNFQ